MGKAAKQYQTTEPTLADIKTAILANCGGWNGASDGEFLAKWKSLSPQTQAEYLKDSKAAVESVPQQDDGD